MNDTKCINLSAALLFIFFCLLVVYSPMFGQNFGYLNDYTIFERENSSLCFGFPESAGLFALGRPLQAILVNLQLLFVTDMQSLQGARFFLVLLIGAAASMFFLYVDKYVNIHRYSAAILSVLLFSLPGMAIGSFWIAQSSPTIFPIFFVLLAHYLFQQKSFLGCGRYCVVASAVVLIVCSLSIYPPATFFFLTLTLMKLVFGAKDCRKSRISGLVGEVFVLFVSCVVYFLCAKYVLKPVLLAFNPGGMDFSRLYQAVDAAGSSYKFSFTFHVDSKISQLYDLMILVFSVWFPPLPLRVVFPLVLVFVLIMTWALVVTPYLKTLSTPSRIVVGLILAVAAPIAPALPVLSVQGDYPIIYRVVFASMAVVPMAFVFAAERFFMAKTSWKLVVPVAICCAGGFFAAELASYHRLELMVARLTAEFNHVVAVVGNADAAVRREIRIPPVVSPPDPFGFLGRDFGYIAVSSSPVGMANAAAGMSGKDIAGWQILYDRLGPRYEADLAAGIAFSRPGYPRFVANCRGISGEEAFGRWTDGDQAVIEFEQPLPQQFVLKITAGASPAVIGKTVDIVVGTTKLSIQPGRQEPTTYDVSVVTDGNARSIAFRFANLTSPCDRGENADCRRLGLALVSLKIDPLHASERQLPSAEER